MGREHEGGRGEVDISGQVVSRAAYTAKHLRDELTELLGDPGENQLSDEELIERIRGVLHDLERDDLESTAQGA